MAQRSIYIIQGAVKKIENLLGVSWIRIIGNRKIDIKGSRPTGCVFAVKLNYRRSRDIIYPRIQNLRPTIYYATPLQEARKKMNQTATSFGSYEFQQGSLAFEFFLI